MSVCQLTAAAVAPSLWRISPIVLSTLPLVGGRTPPCEGHIDQHVPTPGVRRFRVEVIW